MNRIVVWFSCGAASACAAKLAVNEFSLSHEVVVVYCDTMKSEHPDNFRFFHDVQHWLGIPIRVIRSEKYNSIDDVFMQTRYLSGIKGARCTTEMKKIPRFNFQHADDTHVFGYTVDEQARMVRFEKNNPELRVMWILRSANMDKIACKNMIASAGIELPIMYALGYKNNNCIGCVKASSPAYWNAIRRDFPDIFARRAEQSKVLNARVVRLKGERILLSDLPPEETEVVEENLSCGPECNNDK